jgi:hypothetical protein
MDQSNYGQVNTKDYEGRGGVRIDQRHEELKMICPQRLVFMFLAQSNRNGYNMGRMIRGIVLHALDTRKHCEITETMSNVGSHTHT